MHAVPANCILTADTPGHSPHLFPHRLQRSAHSVSVYQCIYMTVCAHLENGKMRRDQSMRDTRRRSRHPYPISCAVQVTYTVRNIKRSTERYLSVCAPRAHSASDRIQYSISVFCKDKAGETRAEYNTIGRARALGRGGEGGGGGGVRTRAEPPSCAPGSGARRGSLCVLVLPSLACAQI